MLLFVVAKLMGVELRVSCCCYKRFGLLLVCCWFGLAVASITLCSTHLFCPHLATSLSCRLDICIRFQGIRLVCRERKPNNICHCRSGFAAKFGFDLRTNISLCCFFCPISNAKLVFGFDSRFSQRCSR